MLKFSNGSVSQRDKERNYVSKIPRKENTGLMINCCRPYTPMMGQLSTVWYDRKQISPTASDNDTVDQMAAQLTELIQSEVDEGIPLNRIILGILFMLIIYTCVGYFKVGVTLCPLCLPS